MKDGHVTLKGEDGEDGVQRLRRNVFLPNYLVFKAFVLDKVGEVTVGLGRQAERNGVGAHYGFLNSG